MHYIAFKIKLLIMQKPKWVELPHKQGEWDESHWEFMGIDGLFNEDDNTYEFCYNIEPDDTFEAQLTAEQALEQIEVEINRFKDMKAMIKYFQPLVSVYGAFYDTDGDYNVYVVVPNNHPKLKKNGKSNVQG